MHPVWDRPGHAEHRALAFCRGKSFYVEFDEGHRRLPLLDDRGKRFRLANDHGTKDVSGGGKDGFCAFQLPQASSTT
jgi:hypothetical protein